MPETIASAEPWRVHLGRLTLPNPVLTAAGTFGYGEEFAQAAPVCRLGGIVTKTLMLREHPGNPPPRLVETPAGLLNSVGLQNTGVEHFLRATLPRLRTLGVPVIVSVLGESPEEFVTLAKLTDRAEGVAALELNLSCPNLKNGSRVKGQGSREELVAQDPEATYQVVYAVRQSTRLPIIAKLSPDVTDIAAIAARAHEAGCDAVALVNTFQAMAIDVATKRSKLGRPTGGLSGPAIRPLAVRRVWEVAQQVAVPIIGMGGVVTAEDALEFLLAGASAVAVGTAHFANPRASVQVLDGLIQYCRAHRLPNCQSLIGACDAG